MHRLGFGKGLIRNLSYDVGIFPMLLVHQSYPVRRAGLPGVSQNGQSASAGGSSIARLPKAKPAVCIARGACSLCAPTQSMGARNTDTTR